MNFIAWLPLKRNQFIYTPGKPRLTWSAHLAEIASEIFLRCSSDFGARLFPLGLGIFFLFSMLSNHSCFSCLSSVLNESHCSSYSPAQPFLADSAIMFFHSKRQPSCTDSLCRLLRQPSRTPAPIFALVSSLKNTKKKKKRNKVLRTILRYYGLGEFWLAMKLLHTNYVTEFDL